MTGFDQVLQKHLSGGSFLDLLINMIINADLEKEECLVVDDSENRSDRMLVQIQGD